MEFCIELSGIFLQQAGSFCYFCLMAKMHQTILLTGGNIPDRTDYLRQAIRLIESKIGAIKSQSSIYESEPWGFKTKNAFLNQVLWVYTLYNPKEVLSKIKEIEQNLGRKQKTQKSYASRTIDIDILFFDDEHIEDPELTIPHIYLHKRRFTLLPLVEIVPNWIHPVFKKSCHQLLEECTDTGKVWLY